MLYGVLPLAKKVSWSMKHIFQCSEGVNRCNKFLLLISGMVRQFSLTDFHLEDVFHVYRLAFISMD